MAERTATVQMDRRGRIVIPKAVRQSLDVDGQTATVEIDIEVVDHEQA